MTLSIEILLLLIAILLFAVIYLYRKNKYIKNNDLNDNIDTALEKLVTTIDENTEKLILLESETKGNSQSVKEFF